MTCAVGVARCVSLVRRRYQADLLLRFEYIVCLLDARGLKIIGMIRGVRLIRAVIKYYSRKLRKEWKI